MVFFVQVVLEMRGCVTPERWFSRHHGTISKHAVS